MDSVSNYLKRLPRQAQLSLAASCLMLLLLLYFVLSPLISIWSESGAVIETLEPRIGRMLGFEESGEELARSLDRARSQLALYTYDAGEDLAGLGASLQQLVREIAEDSGLRVAGSQPTTGEGTDGIDAVLVNVELRGGVEALERFLQELAAATPIIHVETLRIVAPRVRRGQAVSEQSVSASIRVASYRVQTS